MRRFLGVVALGLLFPQLALAQNPARDQLTGIKTPERPRWFTAGSVDLGYKYLRPRLNLGYGIPFGQWLGVDINPLLSSLAVGAYAGVRISTRYVNIRSGVMSIISFDRSFLPIQRRYTREASELRLHDESAKYNGYTTELTLNLPVAGGNLNAETEAIGVSGVPEDRYVFVDTAKVVGGGSWVLRQRLAYTYPIATVPGLMLGPGAEVLILPIRKEQVYRAGVLARWWLYPQLGFRFALLPVVASPDSLGLIGAEFELGLRWLWSVASSASQP
jgi:hypothetical protein